MFGFNGIQWDLRAVVDMFAEELMRLNSGEVQFCYRPGLIAEEE